jgi:hypothetical protein
MIPISAISNIGAFSSLLIAIIISELSIPAVCWTAPDIPHAIYMIGLTVLPVCPT